MTVRPATGGKKSTTTAKKPKTIKGSAKNKPNATATRPGRTAQRLDTGQGPGTYDPRGKGFGDDTKGFTIGIKREKSIEHSPGPGSYDESKSMKQIKYKAADAIDFSRTTGRLDSSGSPPRAQQSPEFGTEFGTVERFYQYPKEKPNFTMGQKRSDKPSEGPGPGEYHVEYSVTKTRTTGYHQF